MNNFNFEIYALVSLISLGVVMTIWVSAHLDAAGGENPSFSQSVLDFEGRNFASSYAWYFALACIPLLENHPSLNVSLALLSLLALLKASEHYKQALPFFFHRKWLRLPIYVGLSLIFTLLAWNPSLGSIPPMLSAVLSSILQFRIRTTLLWQLADDNQILRSKLYNYRTALKVKPTLVSATLEREEEIPGKSA